MHGNATRKDLNDQAANNAALLAAQGITPSAHPSPVPCPIPDGDGVSATTSGSGN